jgi:phosphoribosylamine--glycine ligase
VKAATSILFHAGTIIKDKETVTNGGRVLCMTSFGNSLELAAQRSLYELEKISFKGMSCRSDIGYEFYEEE